MGFLSSLKNSIIDDISSGASLLTKGLSGGSDVIQNIVNRPLSLADQYVAQPAMQFASNVAPEVYQNAVQPSYSFAKNYIAEPAVTGLGYSSELGTGMLTTRFASPYRDAQGNLKASFDTSAALRNLESPSRFLFGGNTPEWQQELQKDHKNGGFSGGLSSLGKNQYQQSDLPTGVKVAGSLFSDPLTYASFGGIGTSLGEKAPLLAEKAPTLLKGLNLAGGFVGLGDKAIPLTLGAAGAAQAADSLNLPGSQYWAQPAGMIAADIASRKLNIGDISKAISEDEFHKQADALRKATMHEDPAVAQAASDALDKLNEQYSLAKAGAGSESSKIPRGPKLDELSPEELNAQKEVEPLFTLNEGVDINSGKKTHVYPSTNPEEAQRLAEARNPDAVTDVKYISNEDFKKRMDMQVQSEQNLLFERARRGNADEVSVKTNPDRTTTVSVNIKQRQAGTYPRDDVEGLGGQVDWATSTSGPIQVASKTFENQNDAIDFLNSIAPDTLQSRGATGNGFSIFDIKNDSGFDPALSKFIEENANFSKWDGRWRWGKSIDTELVNKFKNYIDSVKARRQAEGGTGFFGQYKSAVEDKGAIGSEQRKQWVVNYQKMLDLNKQATALLEKGDLAGATKLYQVAAELGKVNGPAPTGQMFGVVSGDNGGIDNTPFSVQQEPTRTKLDLEAEQARVAAENPTIQRPVQPQDYSAWQRPAPEPLGIPGTPGQQMATSATERNAFDQAATAARPDISNLPPELQQRFEQNIGNPTYQVGNPVSPEAQSTIDKIMAQYKAPQDAQGLVGNNTGNTLEDRLNELIWGKDELGPMEKYIGVNKKGKEVLKKTPSLESAENQRLKFKTSEFARPQTPPAGDYRLRAQELLDALKSSNSDALSQTVTPSEFPQLFRSLTASSDLEKVMNERNAALEQYRGGLNLNEQVPNRDAIPPIDIPKGKEQPVTVYHGTNGPIEGPLRKDAFVTPNANDAAIFAKTEARLNGGTPTVHEFQAFPSQLRPADEEGLMKARGAMQVNDENGLAPAQKPTAPMDTVTTPEQATAAENQIQSKLSDKPPQGPTGPVNYSVTVPEERKPVSQIFGNVRPFEDTMADVKSLSGPLQGVTAKVMGIVNPSNLMTSPAGKAIVAYQRQRLAGDELATAGVQALDRFSRPLGLPNMGNIRVDKLGNFGDTGVHWNDVFANPDKYKGKLNVKELAVINTFTQQVRDLNVLRIANGLGFLPLQNEKGAFYVPRIVKGVGEITIERPTNHALDRLWEFATDGAKDGVKYDDYRSTMKLYAQQTYKEIADQQLADWAQANMRGMDSLVPKSVATRYQEALAAKQSAKTDLKVAATNFGKDKNPDTVSILQTAKDQMKAANGEARAAEFSYNKNLSEIRAQENNKSFVTNPDGTRTAVSLVNIKGAGTRVVSPQDAEYFRNYIGNGIRPQSQYENIVQKGFNVFGQGVRTLGAGFDFVAPFSHNLPLMATHPGRWAKATAMQYMAFANPKVYTSYIEDNRDVINRMAAAGVPVSDNEVFDIAKNTQLSNLERNTIGKIPVLGGLTEKATRQTLGRFETAFGANLTVSRVEMWKANEARFMKNNDVAGLAQFVRNTSGALDPRSLMVSRGQRDLESTWLAFSPKLFRSTVALVGMAMKPTTQEGQAALKTLAIMGTASVAGFYGLNKLAGRSDQEALDSINPTTGKKFMSVKLGDGYYGLGGQYRAMAQLLGVSSKAMATGDFSKMATWDQVNNPILAFYVGRGSPAIKASQDIIEGTTGINANPYEQVNGINDFQRIHGIPIPTKNNLLTKELQQFVPFALSNWVAGETLPQAIGDINGLRTSQFTRAEETQQRAAALGFKTLAGKPITDINQMDKEQQKAFYAQYPVERVNNQNDNVTKLYNQITEANVVFDNQVRDMSANVDMGTMTKQQFKDWYNNAREQNFTKIAQIQQSFSMFPANRPNFSGSVLDYVNSKAITPEDKAVQQYYAISSNTPLNPDGTVNFDGIGQQRQALLTSLPSDQRAYVERQLNLSAQTPKNKLVTEYDIVKQVTAPYWDAKSTLFDAVKGKSQFLSQFKDYNAYQKFINDTAQQVGITPQTLETYLSAKQKDVKLFGQLASKYQKQMRLQNPQLDQALTEWYGEQPANPIDYALSQYGLSAPETVAEAYAQGKGPSRSQAGAFALSLAQNNPGNFQTRQYHRPTLSLQ